MKLLLATHQALLFWDGAIRVLHEGRGVYYGITWSEERLYAVARDSYPARVLTLDRNLNELAPPPFTQMGADGYSGPHQAFWWDGRLYVANTQYNRIEVWDEASGEVSCIRFEDPADKDVDHLNSIWRDPANGRFYAVEHRRALDPKRIREFLPSGEITLTLTPNLDSLAEKRGQRGGLHNVYVKSDLLYSLGPRSIVTYEFAAGHWSEKRLVDRTKYLRGLARTADHWLVGVSNATPQRDRGWGSSTVIMLDDAFEVAGAIPIPAPYGQLLEIRVTDEVDRAHNTLLCPVEGFR